MRIEILVENEAPKIFPLDRPKLLIGSQETCDIPIPVPGVSRRHLVVLTEGDNYFIIDQGSTNGTYMNEGRLVPGKKVQFTTFFPVRLGENVVISLISEEDARDILSSETVQAESTNPSLIASRSSSDKTYKFTMKNLSSARTEELMKNRRRTKDIKKPKSKERENSLTIMLIAFFILSGTVYWQFFLKERPLIVERIAQSPVLPATKVEKAPKFLINPSELISHERLSVLFNDLKCTTDSEKYICQKVPSLGAVQSGTMMIVYVHEEEIQKKSIEELSTLELNEEDLHFLMLAYFLRENWPSEFDYEQFKNMKFTLVFVNQKEEPKISWAAAFLPEGISKVKTAFYPRFLRDVYVSKGKKLHFLKEFTNIY